MVTLSAVTSRLETGPHSYLYFCLFPRECLQMALSVRFHLLRGNEIQNLKLQGNGIA